MGTTLQEMKDYLRVDSEDEDALIQSFMLAAQGYMQNAGVKVNAQGNLYDVVIKMLVALYYENRNTAEKQFNIPPVISHFITQLAAVSLLGSE